MPGPAPGCGEETGKKEALWRRPSPPREVRRLTEAALKDVEIVRNHPEEEEERVLIYREAHMPVLI